MKILFGVPPKDHVKLATEEMEGLKALNFDCKGTAYGKNDSKASPLSKLLTVIINAFAICKVMFRFNPDIVYLSSRIEPKAAVRDYLTIKIIKTLYRKEIKIAIKSHGSDFSLFERKSFSFNKVIIPFLLKNVDGWLLLSTEEMETMRWYRPDVGNRLYLTSNVVTLCERITKDKACIEFGISNDKFKVFFSGRMIKAKGCYDIVNAVPLLNKPNDFLFVFLGDGEELEYLKVMTVKLGIEHLFLFLGYVQEDASDVLIEHMDLLLFPSYDEGFSMVLFKSVAYGLPIITTRVRASKDYLKEEDNVLWVNPNSPEMIAKALEKLYGNELLRQKMSTNNVILGQQFNRENTAQKLFNIFEIIEQSN